MTDAPIVQGRHILAWNGIKKLFSFGFYSGIGVLSDWALLFLLTSATAMPDWFANIISSAVGTTIVYLCVTRRTWRVRQSFLTYAVFLSWYAIVIVGCSIFIDSMHAVGWPPIWSKIATTPVSFGLNYVFNLILFSSRLVRRERQADNVAARPGTVPPSPSLGESFQ